MWHAAIAIWKGNLEENSNVLIGSFLVVFLYFRFLKAYEWQFATSMECYLLAGLIQKYWPNISRPSVAFLANLATQDFGLKLPSMALVFGQLVVNIQWRQTQSDHRGQRSPIWPYFQLNSPFNCSANRSFVNSNRVSWNPNCSARESICF